MLQGLSILIVEDEAIIGLDLALAVEDMEGHVIGPIATVAEGLSILDQCEIAAAILDANLADRDITPLALGLIERGVPIVIHTGTGLPGDLAALHPEIVVLLKPAPPAKVIARLAEQL